MVDTTTVVDVSEVAIVLVVAAADIYVGCAYGVDNDFATLLLLISRICSRFVQAPCDPCCTL